VWEKTREIEIDIETLIKKKNGVEVLVILVRQEKLCKRFMNKLIYF